MHRVITLFISMFRAMIVFGCMSPSLTAQSIFTRNDNFDFAGEHKLLARGTTVDNCVIVLESNSDFQRFKLHVERSRLNLPYLRVTHYRLDLNNDGVWEYDWTPNDMVVVYNYPSPPDGISATYAMKVAIEYSNILGQTSAIERVLPVTIFSTPRVYATSEGDAFVQLRNEECASKIPVLLVEGFDPTNDKFPELYYNLTWDLVNIDLYPNGYEVFILNFHDGGRDLRLNSDVVLMALEKIHEICPNYRIALGGLSMGGPISRYALAKKESQNGEHNVGLFMFYDSPQQPAHANPQLQDWIRLQDRNQRAIALLQDNLSSVAAKQMLEYNTYDPGHTFRIEYYGDLNSQNGDGYPHRSYNVAVSNGDFNATWGYSSAGRQLLTMKINDNLAYDVSAVQLDCGAGSMTTDITMRRYGDIFSNPLFRVYYEVAIVFNPVYILYAGCFRMTFHLAKARLLIL